MKKIKFILVAGFLIFYNAAGMKSKPTLPSLPDKLSSAIEKNEIKTVKDLFQENKKLLEDNSTFLNKSDTDKFGLTRIIFLHPAIKKHDPNLVKLLIDKGADVNARNKYGQTTLDVALVEKNFLQAQINLDIEDVSTAKENLDKITNIIKILKEKGAKKTDKKSIFRKPYYNKPEKILFFTLGTLIAGFITWNLIQKMLW